MPNRWLKEAYLASARINSASPEARDCWLRLVLVADDYGRFHADAQLIASRCYPMKPDARKCARLLDELEGVHLISRYQVEGRSYLQIEQWYERPRSSSKFPPTPTSANDCGQLQASANNCESPRISFTTTATATTTSTTTDASRLARTRATPQKNGQAADGELAEPTAEHAAMAESLGLDCQTEFSKYRDHFQANGRRHKNEVAGFRNWLRRASEFGNRREPKRNDVAGQIFGQPGEPHETDITGDATRVA